jgi:hypothetical protein
LLAYDSFTRSDNALNIGYSNTGQKWGDPIAAASTAAVFGIANHMAYTSAEGDSGSYIFLNQKLPTNDIIVSCDFLWVTDANMGMVCRGEANTPSANHYMMRINGTDIAIWKRINTAFTALGSQALVTNNGQKYNIKIITVGTEIIIKVDGVIYISIRDGDVKGSYVGLRSGNTPATPAINKRWGNFTIITA